MRPPRCCSRTTSCRSPSARRQLADLAATIGADVPFFLGSGPQLGSGDGTILSPVELPADYWVLLVVPSAEVKTSTGDVYRAFDDRDGAHGFAERRDALLAALPGGPAPPRSRPAAGERSRVVSVVRATARRGRVPRRRERRRPLRVRPLRRPARRPMQQPGRCARRARRGSSRRFGKPTRQALLCLP